MPKFKNYEGKIIGTRLIVSYSHTNKWGQSKYTYMCKVCGRKGGPTSISKLKQRKCQGCMKGSNNPNWTGFQLLTGVWLNQRFTDALKRDLKWKLTPSYLWNLWIKQEGKCWYTGRKLTLYVNSLNRGNASLDRIDNTKGYIKGNVKWVHSQINRMKSDFTELQFLQACLEVTVHGKHR